MKNPFINRCFYVGPRRQSLYGKCVRETKRFLWIRWRGINGWQEVRWKWGKETVEKAIKKGTWTMIPKAAENYYELRGWK